MCVLHVSVCVSSHEVLLASASTALQKCKLLYLHCWSEVEAHSSRVPSWANRTHEGKRAHDPHTRSSAVTHSHTNIPRHPGEREKERSRCCVSQSQGKTGT